MSYYKQELKRLKRTRQLLARQLGQLRELHLEGIVTLTLTTTTRTLTLPAEGEAVGQAVLAYYEHLSQQREELRREAAGVRHDLASDQAIRQARA